MQAVNHSIFEMRSYDGSTHIKVSLAEGQQSNILSTYFELQSTFT